MAKRKREEPKRFRFTSACPHCKRSWESDDLSDMPDLCDRCGMVVIVNDSRLAMSRKKRELEAM